MTEATGPTKGTIDETTTAPRGTPAPRALTLDAALYEEMLADADLSDDEKRQFLEALWSIIVGFVDLGFEIHPVQLVSGHNGTSETGCGQNGEQGIPTMNGSGDLVHSCASMTTTTKDDRAQFAVKETGE